MLASPRDGVSRLFLVSLLFSFWRGGLVRGVKDGSCFGKQNFNVN